MAAGVDELKVSSKIQSYSASSIVLADSAKGKQIWFRPSVLWNTQESSPYPYWYPQARMLEQGEEAGGITGYD